MFEKKNDFHSLNAPRDNLIFISSKEDEEMYNEWYGFLKWHKTNVNFVEYKLRTGEDFERNKAIQFFHRDLMPTTCFCVRRGQSDYDFYINTHQEFLTFRNEVLKINVYTIKIGSKLPWERIKGTHERKDKDTVGHILYNEAVNWLQENLNVDVDMEDHPWMHNALTDYSYTTTMTIISSREDYIKEFYLKFYDRIINCEKQMKKLKVAGSWDWSHSRFIWCEITKPNLDFEHNRSYNNDDKILEVSF